MALGGNAWLASTLEGRRTSQCVTRHQSRREKERFSVHQVAEGFVTEGKESLQGAGKRGQRWKINVTLVIARLSGLGANLL